MSDNDKQSETPFALLSMNNIRLCRFKSKEEMLDAARELTHRGIEFVALIYHQQAGVWTRPDVYK